MDTVQAATNEAREHLEDYLARNPGEAGRFEALMAQLSATGNIFDRANMRGHITASAVVLNAELTHVLVIHHNVFKREMPPGGHNEDADPLIQAASREVLEETGVNDIELVMPEGIACPFDIDTHAIAANPLKGEGDHWHHDYTYLFIDRGGMELTAQLDEVAYAAWRTIEDFSKETDSRLRRLAMKIHIFRCSLNQSILA